MNSTTKIITLPQTLRRLDPKEKHAGRNVFKNCLNVRQDEKVLIITDRGKIEKEAPVFFESAKEFTSNLILMEIPPITGGQEPPEAAANKMLTADLVFLITSFSLSHSLAFQNAKRKGVRIASLPGITKETILRTLSENPKEIAQTTKKIAGILTAGKTAHLASRNGTQITFSLEGRDALADTGLITNPGDSGTLPGGAAFISPKEGVSHGTLVFDCGFSPTFVDEKIRLTVKKGRVVKIEGGKAALQLETMLLAIGEKGHNIAELGVGTNPFCRLEFGVLEAEKVEGTIHVALGSSAAIGGEVDIPFHCDGLILKPTLEVDKETIVKEGRILC